MNTYSVFCELAIKLISTNGRVGIIVPTSIATDESNKYFIQSLIKNSDLVSFFDFTNRGYIFYGTESTFPFSLLTLKHNNTHKISLSSQLWKIEHLNDKSRVYNLRPEDIEKLNPNTLNLPIIKSAYDARLILSIYNKIPVLDNKVYMNNPWKVNFRQGLFNMTSDSYLFKTRKELLSLGFYLNQNNYFVKEDITYLPLYESKFTGQYNHRENTFEGVIETEIFGTRPRTNDANLEQLQNRQWCILPRYWVNSKDIEAKIISEWKHSWLIGFRNAISAVADSRSVRFTFLPKLGVGNSMPLLFSGKSPKEICALVANFNSLVLDYIAKQKASGGNLNFYVVRQFPILPPDKYTLSDIEFISTRVLELVYTAWDMQPFAKDMGYNGEPFIWNPNRRALLRAELDAYYAKLYGLTRDELRYILDPADVYGADFPSETFRVLKNNEIKQFGEYRTQRLVLEAWDNLFGS